MSVGCSMCGACCQWIYVDVEGMAKWWTSSDPRIDEEWAKWVENGWEDENREQTINNWLSVTFLSEHWITVGQVHSDEGQGWRFNCDQFDPKTRLCLAHDDRPPVCSEYPWYGKKPTRELAEKNLPSCCSFHADVIEGTIVSIGPPPT